MKINPIGQNLSKYKLPKSDRKLIKNLQMSEAANRIFFYYGLDKPELVDRLVTEKELKNEAYFFLIEMGLFDQFEVYCKRISKEG